MTIINATGTSELQYRAERAAVTAWVSVSAAERAESIKLATELHNGIAARAQELRASGDVTGYSAGAIATTTNRTYDPAREANVVVDFTTHSRLLITFANLEGVSEYVTELAALGVETNVEFSLSDDSRRAYEREARKAAVAEARKTAEDYADALGETIARVVSISDAASGFGGASVRFAAEAASTAELTVEDITVRASVQGQFETTK